MAARRVAHQTHGQRISEMAVSPRPAVRPPSPPRPTTPPLLPFHDGGYIDAAIRQQAAARERHDRVAAFLLLGVHL